MNAAPEDFEIVLQFLTFSSEVTSIQVPISVTDDDQGESQEEFVANLTLVTIDLVVEITPDQATIIIIDDDGTL